MDSGTRGYVSIGDVVYMGSAECDGEFSDDR